MNRSTLKIIALCLYGICSFVLMGHTFHQAFAKETTPKDLIRGPHSNKPPPSDEEIRAAMKKHLGVPYKWAGASKKGFDCSGFVKVVYDEIFGVRLPHQSSQQSLSQELVDAPLDSLITGDLVFFSTSGRNRPINHVGIYIGEGRFIHAARSQGVVVSELREPYWRSKIVGARRLAQRDPVQTERTALALSFDRRNALFFRFERKEEGRLVHGPVSGGIDLFENSGAYAQGVRLSGDVMSFGGFSVSPSISYLDYGPSILDSGLPRIVAGLHLGLVSRSRNWTLSTALRMPLGRSPFSLLDEGLSEHSVDISLAYRQRVSERMALSLSGEKLLGLAPSLKDVDSRFERDDERLTLMLHFFY